MSSPELFRWGWVTAVLPQKRSLPRAALMSNRLGGILTNESMTHRLTWGLLSYFTIHPTITRIARQENSDSLCRNPGRGGEKGPMRTDCILNNFLEYHQRAPRHIWESLRPNPTSPWLKISQAAPHTCSTQLGAKVLEGAC